MQPVDFGNRAGFYVDFFQSVQVTVNRIDDSQNSVDNSVLDDDLSRLSKSIERRLSLKELPSSVKPSDSPAWDKQARLKLMVLSQIAMMAGAMSDVILRLQRRLYDDSDFFEDLNLQRPRVPLGCR